MTTQQPLAECLIEATTGDYNRVARKGVLQHVFKVFPAQIGVVVLNYDQILQSGETHSVTRINIQLRDSTETTKNRLAARLMGIGDEGLGYEACQAFLRELPSMLEDIKGNIR